MHTLLQSAHLRENAGLHLPGILFHLDDDDPQHARVPAAQQLLFPATPRAVCDEIGLNPWAAVKLYDDGWLSFSPERAIHLDEAQEAELRFVGGLVLAGCDRPMLATLLSELPKPYAYELKRLYFDWGLRRWRVLPDASTHPETAFTDWLETLEHSRDVGSLEGIGELARDALARVRQDTHQSDLTPAALSLDGERLKAEG
jgi:hypothetical protein